jgi:hypothetical protein
MLISIVARLICISTLSVEGTYFSLIPSAWALRDTFNHSLVPQGNWAVPFSLTAREHETWGSW